MPVSISGDGIISGVSTLTTGNFITTSSISAPTATFTGNVSIGGTLTYEDVTNVDSIGIITARSGVIISGVTTVSAGSTSAPSITPSGDSNTGIFFPAADNVAVVTNGSERIRVGAAGSIGIGTANPTATLSVNGKIESLQDDGGEGGQIILRASARSGVATQYRWSLDNYDANTRGNDRLRFIREDDATSASGIEALSINTDGSLQFRTSGTKVLNTSGNTILRQSGSVIQVVTNTVTTAYSLTATTETVIYNPMITITPTNSNSLIFFDIQFFGYHDSNNDFYTSLWVRRNSSGTAISSSQGGPWGDWTRNFLSMVATSAHADYHFSCWDLPGTTSAVNYLLTGKNHQSSRTFQLWHNPVANNARQMQITAFEIAQ